MTNRMDRKLAATIAVILAGHRARALQTTSWIAWAFAVAYEDDQLVWC